MKRTYPLSIIRVLLAAVLSICIMIPCVYADVTIDTPDINAPKTLDELRAADVASIARLKRFDSRDYHVITPVKDQGSSDLCWAYATIGASESSILREGIAKGSLSFSPEQLGYFRHNRGADPLGNTTGEITESSANWYNTSGDPMYGATVFSQWCGPVKTGVSVNASNVYDNTDYRLENAICFENAKDRDAIKQAIVRYGSVTFSYNNKSERDYYNAKNETGSASYPHACTLIGWDDTISASKFYPGGASQDGGWIVKNSYDSLPYFYLSYDCDSSSIIAFDYAPRSDYDYNYFYDASAQDFALTLTLKNTCSANVFEAKKGSDTLDEYIKAVNVGIIGKNVTCNVKVYTDLKNVTEITAISDPTNGTLAAERKVTLEQSGIYTITLDTPVKIKKGSYFSVVIQVSNPSNNAVISLSQNTNATYLYKNYWSKSNFAARIKAFTVCKEKTELTQTEHIQAIGAYKNKITAEKYRENNTIKMTLHHEEVSIPKLKLILAVYKKESLVSVQMLEAGADENGILHFDAVALPDEAQYKLMIWDVNQLSPIFPIIDGNTP